MSAIDTFETFQSAPHRVMFFAGALQTLLGVAWWVFDLGARYAGLYAPQALPLPAVWVHATLMIFGVFSFFIFGFLMTALPKWVAMGPLDRRDYLPAFRLLAAGWLAFYAALMLPALLPAALVVVVLGWSLGWRSLWRSVNASMNDNRQHAWAILSANALGIVGVLVMAAGLATQDGRLVAAAIEIGLWCFLVPTFFLVTHRMLPFFSGSVIRGYDEYRAMWPLWAMLAACVGHAVLALSGLRHWTWLVDLPAGAVMFWLAIRWQLGKSLASHLLAMHHLAGLWLATAFVLFGVQSLLAASGVIWGGRMPLHALTVGYFGSLLLGMATRVTLGHSGRLISSDVWSWRLFWLLQPVVLLRLAGEFVDLPGAANLTWLSGVGWLLVFGQWSRVHLLMFLRPRPDGRPG